jgi:hypothetical protein
MTTTTTHDFAANVSETPAHGTRRRFARSAGAVLAGLAVIFAITTATDVALHLTHVFPPMGERMSDGLFLLATAYRLVYGVLGCYVTARMAAARPLAHALLLGAIGTVISALGAIAMWDFGPGWYSLAIIASALPCAWVGGALRLRQLAQRDPAPARV